MPLIEGWVVGTGFLAVHVRGWSVHGGGYKVLNAPTRGWWVWVVGTGLQNPHARGWRV